MNNEEGYRWKWEIVCCKNQEHEVRRSQFSFSVELSLSFYTYRVSQKNVLIEQNHNQNWVNFISTFFWDTLYSALNRGPKRRFQHALLDSLLGHRLIEESLINLSFARRKPQIAFVSSLEEVGQGRYRGRREGDWHLQINLRTIFLHAMPHVTRFTDKLSQKLFSQPIAKIVL